MVYLVCLFLWGGFRLLGSREELERGSVKKWPAEVVRWSDDGMSLFRWFWS